MICTLRFVFVFTLWCAMCVYEVQSTWRESVSNTFYFLTFLHIYFLTFHTFIIHSEEFIYKCSIFEHRRLSTYLNPSIFVYSYFTLIYVYYKYILIHIWTLYNPSFINSIRICNIIFDVFSYLLGEGMWT